jgi:cephalosporin-C deacetylase-like acetyl esterase
MKPHDFTRWRVVLGVATSLAASVSQAQTPPTKTPPASRPAARTPRAAAPVVETRHAGRIVVRVRPDREDWTYPLGARARFLVHVTRNGHGVPGARARYEIGPDNLPPMLAGEVDVPADGVALETDVTEAPGFVYCTVEISEGGRTYRGRAAAAFAPETILPTVNDPDDFDAFWAAGKEQLSAIPMEARVSPAPSSEREVVCHNVNLANVPASPSRDPNKPSDPSRIYGVLCEPEGPGPFPAVLQVPGAGVRGYRGSADLASKGLITFQIGIHGIPVNLESELYDSLNRGALANYPTIHSDDRDRHYYRRVYLGAVRANDFLTSRPRWDRRNLGVMGGSQGGALAIATAALDPRVKGLVSYYPALSDHSGYVQGRTGGWPFLLRQESARTPERIATLAYFDVANFARRLNVPGFYSWGFNDEVCPPTSLYASYNVIKAPKSLLLALETGHHLTPEQEERAEAWLLEQLRGRRRLPPPPPPKTAPTTAQAAP